MRYGLWLSMLVLFQCASPCMSSNLSATEMAGATSSTEPARNAESQAPFQFQVAAQKPSAVASFPIQRSTPQFLQQQVLQLRPNDVIVFAGDSLTVLGAYPGGWLQSFNSIVQMRNPRMNISVIASGVGGNTAANVDARLTSTVLNYNPTVVVLFVGINDAVGLARSSPNPNLSSYLSTMTDIVQKCLLHPGVRSVVIMTPMAYDDKWDGQSPYDSTIDKMTRDLRTFALINRLPLIDVRATIVSAEPIFNRSDASYGIFMNSSHVHPTALGNLLLSGVVSMGFGQ